MHQPIDDGQNDGPMSYDDAIAMVWCLVQEGLVDFKFNKDTGVYDFNLNAKGEAAHRAAMEAADGDWWKYAGDDEE